MVNVHLFPTHVNDVVSPRMFLFNVMVKAKLHDSIQSYGELVWGDGEDDSEVVWVVKALARETEDRLFRH